MNEKELHDTIKNGESTFIEFKNDKTDNENLVKEIGSMLNSHGGRILLGIEDDGTITGILKSLKRWEEKVMNLCTTNIDPGVIPGWETLIVDGKSIGIIHVPDNAPDKPYKVNFKKAWRTFIRVGTTSREASREQEARLYYISPLTGAYMTKPVLASTLDNLDLPRIYDYFSNIRKMSNMPVIEKKDAWESLLHIQELLAESSGKYLPTIAAILLFGRDPRQLIKNSGISVAAYNGESKSDNLKENRVLNAPLIPLCADDRTILFPGLVELTLEFVKRHMNVQEDRSGGSRKERWDYPLVVLRESIVNALIHRDYTIRTDVEISVYSNRIEIISPGSLPNSLTIEGMKSGARSTRNELLMNVMRDYNYVENLGRGVSNTIIPEMKKHNKTEPEFTEEEMRLKLVLYK